MILSHKHRFIFIKTRKTAGTSVELALSRVCGDDDIITPLDEDGERARRELGVRGPQNFEVTPDINGRTNWGDFRPRDHHWNHEPALILQQRIDSEIWKNYLKFTIERNPWDRIVSLYYFRREKREEPATFPEYVRQAKTKGLSNFRLYAMEDKPAVDHIMRYENLEVELEGLSARLKLPTQLKLPEIRAKGQFREDRRPYAEMYDAETRAIVGTVCAREIALLGYAF